jgi:hypothetical protein
MLEWCLDQVKRLEGWEMLKVLLELRCSAQEKS